MIFLHFKINLYIIHSHHHAAPLGAILGKRHFNKCVCVLSGKGISYVLQELFHQSLGMRMDAAHVLVLITDGRAQDNVVPPSRIARALGPAF